MRCYYNMNKIKLFQVIVPFYAGGYDLSDFFLFILKL